MVRSMQLDFSTLFELNKSKKTKKEIFLAQMEKAIPWKRLIKLINPHYTKTDISKGGRPQYPLEKMLRIYFLQQWYSLSDPGVEEFLYDIPIARAFAQVDLNKIPDETTILNFRRLLENHALTKQLFADINAYLVEQGVRISKGTIVDATIINAPSSTKNKDNKRDEEMASTRKNNNYHFGAKLHIGVDLDSCLIHTATVTPANESDVGQAPHLIRESDEVFMGDAGYTGDKHKKKARKEGKIFLVNDKRKPKHTKHKRINLSASQKKRNRKISKIRSKVEHCFRVIKCQFGYRKAKYKGLAKNEAQMFTLLALTNIYMQRKRLIA